LTAYDFASHFKTLQQEIAEQVKADLRKEVEGVSAATGELGTTNEAFRQEVTRFSEVDLEAHFNRHQKLLSDVFNAINSINSLLSTNVQTLVQLQTGQAEVRRVLEEQFTLITKKLEENSKSIGRIRMIAISSLVVMLLVFSGVLWLIFTNSQNI
jgi:hypothetical protein